MEYSSTLRHSHIPADTYLLKFNNRNARTRCKICSKLTKKSPERWYCSGVFIANFEHISHVVLASLTAKKIKFSIKDFFSKCDQIRRIWSNLLKKSLMENFIFCAMSIANFEQVGADWDDLVTKAQQQC